MIQIGGVRGGGTTSGRACFAPGARPNSSIGIAGGQAPFLSSNHRYPYGPSVRK